MDEKPERVPMLKGRFEGKRSLMVIHELPGGGTADLDLRGEGGVSGLGVYNLRFTSDVVNFCWCRLAELMISGRYAHCSNTN